MNRPASEPAPGVETDDAPGRPPSLRRSLLAWLLLPLWVLVPLAAAVVYFLALEPALDSLDHALNDTALALSGILQMEHGVPSLPISDQTARALTSSQVDKVVFAVGDGSNGLLGGDPALLALVGLARPVQPGQRQFLDVPWHGHAMRMVVYGEPCGDRVCPVLVAESLGKRNQASRRVMLAALAAGLMLALCLGVLAWVAVARSLSPLRLTSQALSQRSLQSLMPLPVNQLPREVSLLGDAINDLLQRLRVAAAAQRGFLDDASHQLRTPLAVILSESAQALQEPHPEALHGHLVRLNSAAQRGAHLSRQLLALARAEGSAKPGANAQAVDLARLIADNATEWVNSARLAGQDLGFDLAPATVLGEPWQLRELLGNLLHNAAMHAGRGAQITVRTRRIEAPRDGGGAQGAAVVLEVEDDGPGIAPQDRPRVWDRFYRGAHPKGAGTGLGLAIVQHIARAHGGDAQLHEGLGGRGLCVRITFPAASRAA